MIRLYKLLLLILLTGSSFSANALWFEGNGESIIINGQVAAAREKAIQNALLTLMYHGGASVNALQVVKSGVLEIDKLTMRTNGEIVDMHLLTENIIDDKIQVTVSADIYPFDSCKKDNYAKPLFVGPFELVTPAQAQLGAIYKIPEEIGQRLYSRLRTSSRQVDARQLRTQKIAFNNNSNDIERQMLSVAQDIYSQYDVQYILFGQITDLSDYNETATILGVPTSTTKYRNFQMQLYVIDAINNKTVFQKKYQAAREWPFDVTMRIDTSGSTFWYSEYGKLVNYYIDQSIEDIEGSFSCETTLASVVSIYNNESLVINLGQKNGVRIGDRFKVLRNQFVSFQDSGSHGSLFNEDDTVLEVVSVQPQRALLKATNIADMANIQIRDILSPVTDDDF
jgi:hypothetical protein